MRTSLVPLAVGFASLSMLAGCASPPADSSDDVVADLGSPTAPAGDPAVDPAGIVLADPNAPDPAEAAKRRAPEAVGSVVSMTFGEDSVRVVFAPDAGYEYFEGTTFDIPFSAVAAIDGETAVVLGDLVEGDRLNVWTSTCRESFPVQCDVEAVTAAY